MTAGDPRPAGEACSATIWPHWADRWIPCPGVMRAGRCSAYGSQHDPIKEPGLPGSAYACPAASGGATDGERDVEMHESSRHPVVSQAELREELIGALWPDLMSREWSTQIADHVLALPDVQRLLADAAIAVIRPSLAGPEAFDPIAALRRVEAVAQRYETVAKEQRRLAEKWTGNTLSDQFAESAENASAVAAELRAALAGPDQGGFR